MAGETGQQMAADDARRPRAHQLGGDAEILFPQRQQFRAHRPRQPGPIQQAQDDGNAEEHQDRAPVQRQDRRQRQPQRQMGQAAQDLDQPLHPFVEPAAIVSRQSAEEDSEDEAGPDPQQADGQGDARAIDQAREHVLADLVGAQQMQLSLLRRTDEMETGVDGAPELVFIAAAEEAQLLHLGRVIGVFALQGLGIQLEAVAIDKGADELAFMEQMHGLRRRQHAADILGVLMIGRDELADQDRAIEDGQENP